MKNIESYASHTIKHHRNMIMFMVASPLVVVLLVMAVLISANTRNQNTSAAVNPTPTTNYQPANGKVYSGVRAKDANYNDFLNRTGQSSVALYHTFRKYPENFNYSYTLTNAIPNAVPMISWTLFDGNYCYSGGKPCRPGSTNGSIARGDIDQHIIDRAANIRSYNKPVFLRINWEMNGTWFAFSSYNSSCATSGCAQKTDNTVEQYKDVWRRVAIIMDGGTKAEMNARLAAQGMPGLTTSTNSLPATNNVALVWNASQSGKSDALQYYPGDEFVDWSGIDWYSKGTEDPNNQQAVNTAFNSQQTVPQKIYDAFSGPNSPGKKPFLVGEWGMWGEDNANWMTAFLNWTEARQQVKALVYFNEDSASLHELSHFPNAAAVYKQRLTNSRYIKNGSQVSTVISPGGGGGNITKPTVSLSTSVASVNVGQSTTLTWSATNSPTSCSASGDWTGSKSASGSQSTGALNTVKTYTYTLTCSNAGGSDSKSITVNVTSAPLPPPKPAITLKVTPASVNVGQSTTLTWSATNSPTSCSASGDWTGSKSASGSQSTGALNTVKTYTYTLTCSNAGGSTNATVAAVVLPKKPVVSLSLASSTVASGQSTTLNWSATNNPSTCVASGGWGGNKGSSGSESTGSQTENKTYTLTCSNAGGSDSASVALTVTKPGGGGVDPDIPKPAVTITARPSNVQYNKKATLTWSATNKPSKCEASGSWSGSKPASGSEETAELSEGATYILTCSNGGGNGAASVSVTVVKISDTTGKVTVNTGNGGDSTSGIPTTEIEVPDLIVDNPYIVGEVTMDPVQEEAQRKVENQQLATLDLNTPNNSDTITLNAGPIKNVTIPKPVAYTFVAASTVSLAGLGSYFAIMKLSIFAGIRGRWGL